MSRDVHSCTHWLRPRNSPPPRIWTRIARALLVSKDRRHFFVTPCSTVSSGFASIRGGVHKYLMRSSVIQWKSRTEFNAQAILSSAFPPFNKYQNEPPNRRAYEFRICIIKSPRYSKLSLVQIHRCF